MELRQLRSLVALADNDFNVTQTAEQLHIVQSAVSQHLSKLEEELGLELFLRQGKRLTGLTGNGMAVLHYARKTLTDTDSILAIGEDFRHESQGTLRLATTHAQARYVLPPVLQKFREKFPEVAVQIHQGNPSQLVKMAKTGQVDLALCTEAITDDPELEAVSCYRWNRRLIVPQDHEILQRSPLSLEVLCDFPIITYVSGITGGNHFYKSFAKVGLTPNITLSAADTDVIKTYVREGFGVGIIISFAYSESEDPDLSVTDLSHLFPWEITRIAYKRGRFLRKYESDFVELLQLCMPS